MTTPPPQSQQSQYIQDKNAFLRWVMTAIASGILLLGVNMNHTMNEINERLAKLQTRIDYDEKKNEEQDRQIDNIQNLLFTRPDDVSIKKSLLWKH